MDSTIIRCNKLSWYVNVIVRINYCIFCLMTIFCYSMLYFAIANIYFGYQNDLLCTVKMQRNLNVNTGNLELVHSKH